jgi:ubiquinone/menaquinone biosynthesis C-methylase UbiE
LPGDTYEKAGRSLFLPRRIWHNHKDTIVAGSVNGQRILDVGCGSGLTLKRLKGDVYGVDVGRGFAQHCSRSHEILLQDAHSLGFASNSFDDVICSEVIEHLERPHQALSEFFRILKPNGRLIVTTPKACLRWLVVEYVWNWVRRKRLEEDHRAFSSFRLKRMLQQSGFKLLKVKPFILGCLLLAVAKKAQV